MFLEFPNGFEFRWKTVHFRRAISNFLHPADRFDFRGELALSVSSKQFRLGKVGPDFKLRACFERLFDSQLSILCSDFCCSRKIGGVQKYFCKCFSMADPLQLREGEKRLDLTLN